jgi:acyl-CoA thioesterase FadM
VVVNAASSESDRPAPPDWSDPWPVEGVRREDPEPSAGLDALREAGFRVVFDVDPVAADADRYQEHLNNTAAVRMFNELRIAYVASRLTPDWPRFIRRGGYTVVVRELHVEYQSEGWMHERFVGATRWTHRRGKSGLAEQRLVEATSARPIARAWVVQLLVGTDGVEAFPAWYWEMVGAVEGAPIGELDATRQPWGPA